MKFKLSARDKEQSDIKYDDEDFSAESKLNFSTEFNVSTLATTMWDLGYHDVASITKQLKERNIPMDATAKEIIKAVVDKMTPTELTSSWKSYLKKADFPFRGDEPVDPSELRPKQRGCQHDFDDYYKGNKLISECKKCGYSFENR